MESGLAVKTPKKDCEMCEFQDCSSNVLAVIVHLALPLSVRSLKF